MSRIASARSVLASLSTVDQDGVPIDPVGDRLTNAPKPSIVQVEDSLVDPETGRQVLDPNSRPDKPYKAMPTEKPPRREPNSGMTRGERREYMRQYREENELKKAGEQ